MDHSEWIVQLRLEEWRCHPSYDTDSRRFQTLCDIFESMYVYKPTRQILESYLSRCVCEETLRVWNRMLLE